MIPTATLERLHTLWSSNPTLSAAAVVRRLERDGHRISAPAARLYRPLPPVPKAAMDPEPTRAILRARAAELGFVAFDGPSLPHGALTAIARMSRRRGYIVTSTNLRYAWAHGVRELEEWSLCEPFLNGGKP